MKLYDVLRDSFNTNESEMNDNAMLRDYAEWDSMTHMLFITKLEDAYDVELDGDEIADMQTVADIKNILLIKGKAL